MNIHPILAKGYIPCLLRKKRENREEKGRETGKCKRKAKKKKKRKNTLKMESKRARHVKRMKIIAKIMAAK